MLARQLALCCRHSRRRSLRAAATAAPLALTEQSLSEWLLQHGVPVELYGQGTAKRLADLLNEVHAGETQLVAEGGAVVRRLRVLQLHVRDRRGRFLVDAAQTLPDGRRRPRELPPSEKLLPHEGWRDAAVRCVAEEFESVLGGADALTLREGSVTTRCVRRTSPSYPGLASEYDMTCVEAAVEGLPQVDFVTREKRPGGELVTHWEWRDEPPADF